MAAYLISNFDISDPNLFAFYVPPTIPLLQKYGGEILTADYSSESLEGDKRDVIVVVKFASEEKARGFYDDPAYAPAKDIRQRSTLNGSVILAAGLRAD